MNSLTNSSPDTENLIRPGSYYGNGIPYLPIDGYPGKIIAIEGRFILGLYRREMKAISYLGKVEKQLGVPVTTRNWNTIEKVVAIIRQDSED